MVHFLAIQILLLEKQIIFNWQEKNYNQPRTKSQAHMLGVRFLPRKSINDLKCSLLYFHLPIFTT